MIATGRSQSAFRLVTYINAFHPLTHAFDGYLVHSRGSNAAGLTAEALARDADNPIPSGAHIRTDIDVPVFDLQTEGDMVALRAHLTHQDPNPHYRRWEIAGGAHAESSRWVVEIPPALDMGQGCKEPINTAPHHAVVKAGLRALTRWVRDGVVPRQSPSIELGDPAAVDPVVRDKFGNAKGGIRLPEVEAPTATIDGRRNDVAQATPGGQNFCFLFGRTIAFDQATLAALYPSHQAFVDQFTKAVDSVERDGYFLKPEGAKAGFWVLTCPLRVGLTCLSVCFITALVSGWRAGIRRQLVCMIPWWLAAFLIFVLPSMYLDAQGNASVFI